jgi:hypothetical protein
MPPGRSKILCVAEKNSISKAVAGHLSGGQFTAVSAEPGLLFKREIRLLRGR